MSEYVEKSIFSIHELSMKGIKPMSNRQSFVRYGAAFLLVFVAAFSRLLPHPANFTAIAAIALFGGVYLEKRFAVVIPILAMLISDYFIGFYSGMYWVYGSFVLIGLIGVWLRNHKKPLYIRRDFCKLDRVFCDHKFWSMDDSRIDVCANVGRTAGMLWLGNSIFPQHPQRRPLFLSQSCSLRMKDCS